MCKTGATRDAVREKLLKEALYIRSFYYRSDMAAFLFAFAQFAYVLFRLRARDCCRLLWERTGAPRPALNVCNILKPIRYRSQTCTLYIVQFTLHRLDL
jgi:hypothetical protein